MSLDLVNELALAIHYLVVAPHDIRRLFVDNLVGFIVVVAAYHGSMLAKFEICCC